jgi:hypothetical protein
VFGGVGGIVNFEHGVFMAQIIEQLSQPGEIKSGTFRAQMLQM